MGFKDHIHPPLVVNATRDFSILGSQSPTQSQEETGDDDASVADTMRATAAYKAGRKPKHSPTTEPAVKVLDFLIEKWEKELEKSDAEFDLKII